MFVFDQEVITKCSTLYWERVEGYGLDELVSSCGVLFLRVQEFLRELVVGVMTPSDLGRSIRVKILHSGEGGGIEQVAQTSKQISRICDCLSLSHLCLYILHAFIVYILTCLIYLCFIDIHCFNILHSLVLNISLHAWYCHCACVHTCIKPRELK